MAEDLPPPPYTRHDASQTASGSSERSAPPASYASSSSALHTPSGTRSYSTREDTFDCRAKWNDNGTVEIPLEFQEKLPDLRSGITANVKEYALEKQGDRSRCDGVGIPRLNIVIFFLGSKADLIPLLLIALELIKSHSHRVRIATQEIHRDTIRLYSTRLHGLRAPDGAQLEDNLEFYDVLARPEFSLKDWSEDPSQMEITLRSFYRSTYLPDENSGIPFAADHIISTPEVLAHVHLAELYGIPLHIISTRSVSPTISTPHYLSRVENSSAGDNLTNYLSHAIVEDLIWQDLGKTINKNFRQVPLGLEYLDGYTGPSNLDRLKIPVTYLWDEGIIKRPEDWKEHIDITGFVLDEGVTYQPDDELLRFLQGEQKTIYVRPGSAFLAIVREPHKRFGLRCLWPKKVYELHASPRPILIDQLSIEVLSVALDEAMSTESRLIAKHLADTARSDDGVIRAVKSVHKHLPLLAMRCDIAPDQAAIWYHPKSRLLLSAVVAGTLLNEGKMTFEELSLNRPKEYAVAQADSDPMIGGVHAFYTALSKSPQSVKYLFDLNPPSRIVDIPAQQNTAHVMRRSATAQVQMGPAPITDFKSGMKEARREMSEGVKDGVKGFVNGPLEPLKRGNVVGGVFGLVGGTIGLVTNPLAGAIRSLDAGTRGLSSEINATHRGPPEARISVGASSPADVLRKPRENTSIYQAQMVSEESKRWILEAYKKAKTPENYKDRKARENVRLKGEDVPSYSKVVDGGVVIQFKKHQLEITQHESERKKTEVDVVGEGMRTVRMDDPPLLEARDSESGGSNSKWWKGKGKGKGKEKS
uniref:Glycosyltransferase family 28 N-terminal domain-containing protein n=1 Tax=Kwoniella dejecticola CBS 10117 TaxID=1296121 RepID=A0A1A5ZZT2_9TREE|nr:uncharacterized protein I303_06886 [Kwoniella dejecticola CBS 10117]OBR83321.1 hypothetical protein I303_06886 [Kwoniella dejecticola CBS 10117]